MQDGACSCSTTIRAARAASASSRCRTGGWGWRSGPLAKGTLTVNLMLSLDPATARRPGLQPHHAGRRNVSKATPLIDHQHPHDFLMQAVGGVAASVRHGFALTFAGAPIGEPALGPIAFMHRSSAAENPMSPLGHHTLRLHAHRDGRADGRDRSRSRSRSSRRCFTAPSPMKIAGT